MTPQKLLEIFRKRATEVFVAIQYWSYRLLPIREEAFFEAFQGKVTGDNPYYVFQELAQFRPNLRTKWSLRPSNLLTPQGSAGVTYFSADWASTMARSRYLVNNSNFPWFFRKRNGQIYLQTWHGTPLKKLMRDIPGVEPSRGYLESLEREGASWDYLISPNAFCSSLFPRLFNFSGTLLELGYPRNDPLVSISQESRREIRKSLGIESDGVTVVLYAPTWRDYLRDSNGSWSSISFIEKKLTLPMDHVLLYRGHTNTFEGKGTETPGIDVTNHPSVTDLCIAADVLVTDYSSIMFDFTITRKPIVIFAPDFETYERERGFYFDFRHEVPGPIVHTQSELEGVLASLGSLPAVYSTRYDQWAKRFHAWEHGDAASITVETVFSDA